jgi:hypothetical protein
MKGVKHDQGKTRYDLVNPRFLEALAKVLTMGASKYGANNWKDVDDFEARYTAALHRHINQWQQGEELDQESGLHHLAHATCNLMFLMDGVHYANKDVQRRQSDPIESDGKPRTVTPGCGKTDPDKGDKLIVEHINELAEILSNGGSSKHLRACINDFRSRRGIKKSLSPDNQA